MAWNAHPGRPGPCLADETEADSGGVWYPTRAKLTRFTSLCSVLKVAVYTIGEGTATAHAHSLSPMYYYGLVNLTPNVRYDKLVNHTFVFLSEREFAIKRPRRVRSASRSRVLQTRDRQKKTWVCLLGTQYTCDINFYKSKRNVATSLVFCTIWWTFLPRIMNPDHL